MIKKYGNRAVVSRLRRRVKKLLEQYQLTIVIVTGTVGKTSAKLAIGQVLSAAGRKVCFSEDSYNTEIGIPLSLFGLKAPDRLISPMAWVKTFHKIDAMIEDYPYDTIIMEVAEDERDLMMPWVELLQPQIGVLTGVSPAHMVRFATIDQLLQDSIALVSEAKQVFYDADFDIVRTIMERKKDSRGYGLVHGNLRFEAIARTRIGQLQAELVDGRQRIAVRTQMIARTSLASLLAAASVARALEVPVADLALALNDVTGPIGRMRLLAGVNGSRLIDDTYNSSPAAVTSGLDTLVELPAKSRIAVLGSMNELGEHAASLHRQVGQAVAEHKLDLLVTVGKDANAYIVPAAIEAGMSKDQVKQFKTPYEAGHYLKKIVQENDLIFIKGSQNGVYAEEVSRILLDPNLHPSRELVRQSKVWKKRKRKSFGL